MKIRKPIKISSNKVDVLIIDEVGSEWIQHCIPEFCSIGVLPLRGVIPWIKRLNFFIKLLMKIKNKRRLAHSLLETVIDIIDPKIVVTFIDNGSKMSFLQKVFPDKLIISVQNGFRVNKQEIFKLTKAKNYKLPVYFGFGDYDYDLMVNQEVQVKKYIPAGSLKLGLFLNRCNGKLLENRGICFISQYRYGMINSADYICQRFVELSENVYNLTKNFCMENNYNCKVAMASEKNMERYNKEVNFFQKDFDSKSVQLIPNNNKQLKSYETAYSSEVLVAMDSTLSFEMFGCGKKVLFCDDTDPVFVKKRGMAMAYAKMPKEILLDAMTPKAFKEKMDILLEMNDEEYLKLTREARSYFMKCEKPYSHKRIKAFIEDHLFAL
jgi:surface carbohydrate biosynthesis protein